MPLLGSAVAHPMGRCTGWTGWTTTSGRRCWRGSTPPAGRSPRPACRDSSRTRCAARPQAPALVFDRETLSYAELNRRANHLAHWLIGQGVGPERLVGIALERSAELVVAVLGILKAGAAYLPLDPDYPPGRLAQMLEDAARGAGADDGRVAGPAAGRCGAARLARQRRRSSGSRPVPRPRPDGRGAHRPLRPGHPAYVIYTSGSTGTPKGVVIEHPASPTWPRRVSSAWSRTARDDDLLFASISFDAVVWELCLALLTMAPPVILAPSDRRTNRQHRPLHSSIRRIPLVSLRDPAVGSD